MGLNEIKWIERIRWDGWIGMDEMDGINRIGWDRWEEMDEMDNMDRMDKEWINIHKRASLIQRPLS